MIAHRQELRPRSPVELYDAALHLCVHTRSELPVIAVLGASSVAASGLVLLRQAQRGHPILLASGLFCVALVFRLVCQGAATLAATRELEGNSLSALAALRQAFSHLPSFVTATVLSAITEIVLFAASSGLSAVLFPVQFLGPALIADGSAHGWNYGRTARRRLKGRIPAALAIRALHGLVFLLAFINIHSSVLVAVALVHSLTGIDTSFVSHFASPAHAFYDVVVVAVAAVLLEPVRCATMALVLADARVRHEGFDLVSALRRIRDELPRLRAGAAVVLALLFVGGTARADQHAPPKPKPAVVQVDDDAAEVVEAFPPPTVDEAIEELPDLADELGLDHEPSVRAGLDRLDALTDEEREHLPDLVVRMEHELDGDLDANARQELRAALTLMGKAKPVAGAPDPREAVREVLASDDFDDDVRTPHAKPAEDEDKASWWTQLWKRIFDWLDRWMKEDHSTRPHEDSDFRLDASVAEYVTIVLIALTLGVVAVALWQTRRRRRADAQGAAGGLGGGANGEPVLDALSRPTHVWSEDADRLAAEGRFREAIRSLYLALLSSLHRRGAIDYHPALSNWDYCAAFRGEAAELPPFRDLTRRFDYGWYGRRGTDEPGYAAFKQQVGPLLGHRPVVPSSSGGAGG